jgi:hypothetical protein
MAMLLVFMNEDEGVRERMWISTDYVVTYERDYRHRMGGAHRFRRETLDVPHAKQRWPEHAFRIDVLQQLVASAMHHGGAEQMAVQH